MILSNVNIGTGPSAGDGDPLRTAFDTINDNFAVVKNNVVALTNSVTTVAGRSGNVVLTINDIIGINTYASTTSLTTANVAMKGYVDAKIAANVAALIDSAPGLLDTLNELAAALNDDSNFAANIVNTINSTNSNVTVANTNMKGYVDGQISAVNSAITFANTIQSNQITAANLGMKGYVDSVASQSLYGNANVSSFIQSYSGNLKAGHANIQGDDPTGLNSIKAGVPGVDTFGNTIASFHANVNSDAWVAVHNTNSGPYATSGFMATADIGDDQNNHMSMGIVNSTIVSPILKPLDGTLIALGGNLVIISGYEGLAKDVVFITDGSYETMRIQASSTTTANLILGANTYLKFADDSIQSTAFTTSFVNAAVSTANLGMKGYVDSVASQSIYGNANVASYLHANDYSPYSNVNVAVFTNLSTYAYAANVTAANLGMKGYVDSVASQSIYGNSNVKSYLTGGFDGNIVPSANVTYSLGNVTNRWKDLYLSGNTIFLGDSTISTEGGRLVTTGVAISPPTGAVAFANVQFEAATNFDQIRSYYVDNNFGYTANLKTWTTAPIVWDELRSAKIKINSSIVAGSTPDFASLDTSGGRFANAVATLDATGNIASLAITDGGVGYDSYYPYYTTDSTGYDTNYIGQSYTGSPTGKSFRRIGLIPTTGNDVGNITSIGSFTRYSDLPTVGTNSYTWTGNTGTTISFTVDWSSNTVTSYTYTPALPALTSAQDWQDWLLDYQSTNDYGWIIGSGSITGGGGTPIQAVYDYLSREALPTSLTYDQSATIWYPGNLLINNASVTATLSSSTFFITFNRTSINYATLENDYGNPVYWSRGLSADTGISSGGDMTVAGDLRVAGDLYVSPTSIYMGDLRISAADGNLKINTGIKFSDDSVQSTAYSNVQVAAYLTANPPASTYSNVQVATYLPTYTGNVAAGNVKVSNAYRFETGNVNITNESSHLNLNPDTTANALAGVKIGGSGFLLGPNGARNLTLNYNSVSGAVGLQGNVTIGSAGSGNLFVLGNVIARDITGGNILATGTSGVLGFNSGGFAQQATSNSTQVTSHFTSGNIQLMSIDLGAHAVHTVAFACNKLTTNDLLLVKHIGGGLTSVYVDAYVASDGLAVIWLRDITGSGTGAFTPMLKYAIVRAPSS